MITREVYKVLPQLVRHILMMTQVDSCCTWIASQCVVHHNDRERLRSGHQLRNIDHGAVFRIQPPPPLRPEWKIGQAVRVAHETGELIDFPEAGQLAYSIMDSSIEANRRDYSQGRGDGARLVSCKGTDQTEDTDIPMMFLPGAQLPDVRPPHVT